MKKIMCFILILLFIPCSFSFAFGGEGLYDIAYPFDENGHARVVLNEKWGVIDLKGENVLPFEYEYISECKGGLIKVKKNSLFGSPMMITAASSCSMVMPERVRPPSSQPSLQPLKSWVSRLFCLRLRVVLRRCYRTMLMPRHAPYTSASTASAA